MLNNDYSLSVSFAMAAQIGLEETVLLTFLKQQAYLINSEVLQIDIKKLSEQLPFWTAPIMMRILTNLQISQLLSFQRQDGVLDIYLATAVTTKESSNKTNTANNDVLIDKVEALSKASFEKHKALPSSPKKYFSAPQIEYGNGPAKTTHDRRGVTDFDLYLEQKERSRQPDQWQPEEATLEQITQAGIAREFAMSLQPEFLLRIKEQRKNVRTWNSEFFKYVKRQWQYKQSDKFSYEGTSDNTKFGKASREQVSDALTNIHDTDW